MIGGDCSVHQKFSIMLQERLDSELRDLGQQVQGLQRGLAEARVHINEARISARRGHMRAMLTAYMGRFPNHLSSPTHYLQSLCTDLQAFVDERQATSMSTRPIIRPMHSRTLTPDEEEERMAGEVCRPFLRCRSSGSVLGTRNARHERELQDRMMQIARLCVQCSDDALMEIISNMTDIPDLMSESGDEEEQGTGE